MVRYRSRPFVGKRSGVKLDLSHHQPQTESIQEGELNEFFAAAAAAAASKTVRPENDDAKETETQQQTTKQPSRKMRFSLEGQDTSTSANCHQGFNQQQQMASSGMFRMIRNFSGAITEADLSPVSAASPIRAAEPESETKPSPLPTEQKSDEKPSPLPSDPKSDEKISPLPFEPKRDKKLSPIEREVPRMKELEEEKEEEFWDEEEKKEEVSPQKNRPLPLPPQPAENEEPYDEVVGDPPLQQDDDYEDAEYEEPDDSMPPSDQEVDEDAEMNDDDVSRSVDGSDDDLIPPAPPDSPGDNDSGSVEEEMESAPEAPKNTESVEFQQEKKRSPIGSDRAKPNLSYDHDSEEEEAVVKVQSKKEKLKKEKKLKKDKKLKKEKKQLKQNREVEKKKLKSSMKKDKREREKVDEESDNDDSSRRRSVTVTTPPKKKQKKGSRFATTFSPKGIPLPREYETVPISDLKETPPSGVRRSKRARLPPLAYWKGEKAEYGPLDDDETISSDLFNMPVVKGYLKAKETPYKSRKLVPVNRSKEGKDKKSKTRHSEPEGVRTEKLEDYDSTKIRKRHNYNDGEEAVLWDEGDEESKDLKVVSYQANMDARRLPLSKARSKAEGKVVGKAAQAFNVPNGPKPQYVGYITGSLSLPPNGIKDAESVGSCSQVFTVVSCQPGGLEVAYADPEDDSDDATFNPDTAERFLLKPRDMFRVPPGNAYRLCNHSKTTEAFLTWTIIRPAVLSSGNDDSRNDDTP